jgi:hypothetical protein
LHYSTSILYFHIRKIHFSIFAHGKIKSKELSRLPDQSHYNEKNYIRGRGGVPAVFFLHKYRKFPGFPAEIPEISKKFPETSLL